MYGTMDGYDTKFLFLLAAIQVRKLRVPDTRVATHVDPVANSLLCPTGGYGGLYFEDGDIAVPGHSGLSAISLLDWNANPS